MSESCGGCNYCKFPYKATPPIKIDGAYEERLFNSKDDVLDIVHLLMGETRRLNMEKNQDFDPVSSVLSQIPFFTCPNHIREPKYLKLLNKYIYCTETGTPAKTGGFGEQSAKWVEYFFLIKNALAKKEKQMHDKLKREAKSGK